MAWSRVAPGLVLTADRGSTATTSRLLTRRKLELSSCDVGEETIVVMVVAAGQP